MNIKMGCLMKGTPFLRLSGFLVVHIVYFFPAVCCRIRVDILLYAVVVYIADPSSEGVLCGCACSGCGIAGRDAQANLGTSADVYGQILFGKAKGVDQA